MSCRTAQKPHLASDLDVFQQLGLGDNLQQVGLVPPKILIVEDDLATRVGLQELLQAAGFDAVAASDFPEGRRLLEGNRPDLLIVDLRLEGYNGLQLLHINPWPVPTVVITGYPDDALQADARRLGAEYLIKPIHPAELLRLVDRLLHGERQFAPPAAARPLPERRRVKRVPIPVDLLVEINTIPARLVDASTSGVQFEMYRPHGYSVPASLRLVFPVHDVELGADLVWSMPEPVGRWRAGASITRVFGDWDDLLRAAG
jgi:CheY-like chemotaxis protein